MPRIASQGSNFGIVWSDFSSGKLQVYFVKYSPNSCTATSTVAKISPVSTNTSADPDVVYAGLEYGVTWHYQDSVSFNNYLMFSRVDQAGAKVAGSDVTIAQVSNSPYPRIDWSSTNSEYGIAYLDSTAGNKLAFARVNSAGAKVGAPIVYSTDSVSLNASADFNVASGGANWGLVWSENSGGGRFMRIDKLGAKQSPVLPLGGYGPNLGWDGAAFLYAYPGPPDVFTVRITCP